jgi:succinate dehydrogenase / fumarate reductase, cytochrome b subunit
MPARPVFLNLLHIAMPVGALVSILHRVSGLCLVAGTPACIYLLDLSLRGPQEFDQVRELFNRTTVRVAAVVFTWVLAHHVLAGLRHLLSDIDIGARLPQARRSAWGVHVGAVTLAALCAGAWL